ncbi:hypothetical protein Srubr_77520 [Streptomyces rubradiris]|uniref:Uncharacterized protein n=1 Tax=Streptomyces rubradiris TaxID=285531 RepID=A0ABQ3RPV8_STRRR|nr:hypothetical protein GCM10018792_48990 [Streptomyces rubradiris]GHI57906.1 hypothetical protein Srubr_77520 [Streptomyces rubradiris]
MLASAAVGHVTAENECLAPTVRAERFRLSDGETRPARLKRVLPGAGYRFKVRKRPWNVAVGGPHLIANRTL